MVPHRETLNSVICHLTSVCELLLDDAAKEK